MKNFEFDEEMQINGNEPELIIEPASRPWNHEFIPQPGDSKELRREKISLHNRTFFCNDPEGMERFKRAKKNDPEYVESKPKS